MIAPTTLATLSPDVVVVHAGSLAALGWAPLLALTFLLGPLGLLLFLLTRAGLAAARRLPSDARSAAR